MIKMRAAFKQSFILLLFLIFSSPDVIHAKIRLFTFHYNRADFLEYQYRCLKKFLKEKNDFELIVFSDATNEKYKQEIEDVCKKFGLACINFPQELHQTGPLIDKLKKLGKHNGDHNGKNGSVRHCQLVKYALDNFGYKHGDLVGIMEGDVFLIREFSIREYLKNYALIGTLQHDRSGKGLDFIWIGSVFMNLKKLPNAKKLNFDLTFVDGVFLDSGGSTYYYLKDNPKAQIKKCVRVPVSALPRNDTQKLKQSGFSEKEIRFLKETLNCKFEEANFLSIEFHLDNHFLHYGWSRCHNGMDAKSIMFKNFLDSILS